MQPVQRRRTKNNKMDQHISQATLQNVFLESFQEKKILVKWYLDELWAHQREITRHPTLHMTISNPKSSSNDTYANKGGNSTSSWSCNIQLQCLREDQWKCEIWWWINYLNKNVPTYNNYCKWAQEEQCVPRQIAQPSVDLCLMIRVYGSCGEDEWLICQCNNSSGVILLNSESIKQYIRLYQ